MGNKSLKANKTYKAKKTKKVKKVGDPSPLILIQRVSLSLEVVQSSQFF